MNYVGRFAPSPSGPLHFGSLIAAVASYLDAKSNSGSWLVRMEDLDPPREPAGAADEILQQLDTFQLAWDGEVLYQSSRLPAYKDALAQLDKKGLCFACNCTRNRLQSLNSIYDGKCREYPTANASMENDSAKQYSVRVKAESSEAEFTDLIQGEICNHSARIGGDFVIKRKDKLFAYQLAVVVDDAFQNISHVVRGYDLLDSTPRQLYLQRCLGLKSPQYAHFPIASDANGNKLSKQHFAEPVDRKAPAQELINALIFLGLNPNKELTLESPKSVLQWAAQRWDIQNVPKLATISGLWTKR